jgi:hypothetical protein
VGPFESGRRLCLLLEAGRCRYAIEATAVIEVAQPDADGRTLRGALELRDLSMLLGGEAEERPGIAVVLDVSPTLAIRARRVVEVSDVARATRFGIPPALGEALGLVARGTLLHADRLYFELTPEAIPQHSGMNMAPPPRPIYLTEANPERALVFESQRRLFGIPLPLVSQVIPRTQAFCPMPGEGGPVAGLQPYEQALWPVYSAPALMGAPPLPEPLVVLAELAGAPAGLCASRVLGLVENFSPSQTRGEFVAPGLEEPALFLDLQRMFS